MNVICKLLDESGIEHRSFTAAPVFAHTATREWSDVRHSAYIVAGTEIISIYRNGLSVPVPDVGRAQNSIIAEVEVELAGVKL